MEPEPDQRCGLAEDGVSFGSGPWQGRGLLQVGEGLRPHEASLRAFSRCLTFPPLIFNPAFSLLLLMFFIIVLTTVVPTWSLKTHYGKSHHWRSLPLAFSDCSLDCGKFLEWGNSDQFFSSIENSQCSELIKLKHIPQQKRVIKFCREITEVFQSSTFQTFDKGHPIKKYILQWILGYKHGHKCKLK